MPTMTQMPISRLTLLAAATTLLLAACSSAPPPPPAPVDTTTPAQRIAEIDKVAGADDTELSVQPLRDPQVDDLREAAKAKRAGGDLGAASGLLDQALALVPQDPGVLQERAELALLQGDSAAAERFAKQALDLGSRTGPLCRRHWATIEQARLARGEQENATSAHAQIEGCTVPGIKRY
jgi:tetratricopeptide (TPR) repeat protein